MAAKFQFGDPGPGFISAEPQKDQPPDKSLVTGVESRPFSDEEIKQAFDTFDLDKNRFVGAHELLHILQLIGEEVTDEEIDEMIRLCDTDGDGQVTFDEFYKLMTQPPPPLPPIPPKQHKSSRQRVAAAKKYARSATQKALGDVGAPSAMSALAQKPAAGAGKKQKSEEKKLEEAQRVRAVSVETLVRKLSGGIGKIKPSQIKKVYKRFQDIDVDKSGAIDYQEFISAMDIEETPVSRQMFRVFDMDGSGSIELKEFIVVLSRYTSAAKTEKLKFAFMMFDEDGSGYIERGELIQMLQASFVVEGYSMEELEERCDKVFDFLYLPRDGAISYEDFLKLSSSKNGLIYPIEQEGHMLGQDVSINKYLEEADDTG